MKDSSCRRTNNYVKVVFLVKDVRGWQLKITLKMITKVRWCDSFKSIVMQISIVKLQAHYTPLCYYKM